MALKEMCNFFFKVWFLGKSYISQGNKFLFQEQVGRGFLLFRVFTFFKLDFFTFKCTSFSRKGNSPNLRPLNLDFLFIFLTVKTLNLTNILFLDEENLNFIAGTL